VRRRIDEGGLPALAKQLAAQQPAAEQPAAQQRAGASGGEAEPDPDPRRVTFMHPNPAEWGGATGHLFMSSQGWEDIASRFRAATIADWLHSMSDVERERAGRRVATEHAERCRWVGWSASTEGIGRLLMERARIMCNADPSVRQTAYGLGP